MNRFAAIALTLSLPVPLAFAQPAPPAANAQRAPDLADQLAGTYKGDVISDARGASRSNVTITVTRTGRNLIRVSSDYPRIPTVSIPLTQAMSSILAASGPSVVVVNLAQDPGRLDLTIDDASWSGQKVTPR